MAWCQTGYTARIQRKLSPLKFSFTPVSSLEILLFWSVPCKIISNTRDISAKFGVQSLCNIKKHQWLDQPIVYVNSWSGIKPIDQPLETWQPHTLPQIMCLNGNVTEWKWFPLSGLDLFRTVLNGIRPETHLRKQSTVDVKQWQVTVKCICRSTVAHLLQGPTENSKRRVAK